MAVSTTSALFESGLSYRREEKGKCVVLHSHPSSSEIKNLDICGIKKALAELYGCNDRLKGVLRLSSKDCRLSVAITEAINEHAATITALKSKLFDEQFKNGKAPTHWTCP